MGKTVADLNGTDGNDTITTDGTEVTLAGGSGDDTYIISWPSSTTNSPFTSRITDSNGTTSSGHDILDLSAVADSIDQIDFEGEGYQILLKVHDINGNLVGRIHINDQLYSSPDIDDSIEILIIDGKTYSLTGVGDGTGQELQSKLRYGATSGNDNIVGSLSGQPVFGWEGDDTLTSSASSSSLFGGDGDDVLLTNNQSYTKMYGEDGNNTYVINWEFLEEPSGWKGVSIYQKHLSNYARSLVSNDTLDVSAVIDTIDQLLFSSNSSLLITETNGIFYTKDTTHLYMLLYDKVGALIGKLTINHQFTVESNQSVTTLVLGNQTIDLTKFTSGDQINDQLRYGITTGNDIINGNNIDDRIKAKEGNDLVTGAAGNDSIEGGAGQDTLMGGSGTDKLYGDNGNDFLSGGPGLDSLYGGAGDDALWAGTGDNSQDIMKGQAGNDTIGGGAGNDNLDGGDGSDVIFGGSGNDYIHGGLDAAPNEIWSGTGGDQVYGSGGADTIGGGTGHDSISAGAGEDIIYGGKGSDGGNDTINGDAGDDTIYASRGTDRINGGTGDDQLYGGADNDTLSGGDGDDLLYGGAGNDELTGGAGADTFAFFVGFGKDTITDFETGDVLDLSGVGSLTLATVQENTIFENDNATIAVTSLSSITLEGISKTEFQNFIDVGAITTDA